MNESLNIPAILKGKPQGTKLHDLVRCIDVYLSNVDDSNEVHCFEKTDYGCSNIHLRELLLALKMECRFWLLPKRC